MNNCIIDGVWPKGEIYTFTIRSLVDEDIFYYLGAFSKNEAEDWVKMLKNAVVIILISEK